jgi:glycosyltransferase involved in cell wall biosynthesis
MRVVTYYQGALERDSGPSLSVRGWAEALANAGAEVKLVVDKATARLSAPENVDLVTVSHTLRGRLRRPASLSGALRAADVLVLGGFGTLANVVAMREARRLGVPYIVAAYGVFFPRILDRKLRRKQLWNLSLERNLLRRALAIHLFFREEGEGLDRLGVDVPLIVVPTGFAPPPNVTWQGGGEYVLWLGRFDVQTKGLDLLLRGIQVLPPAERPRFLLHGPDWRGGRDVVSALISELGLRESVTVGEPVYGAEKWRLLSEAAAFVYPSRWDACPVSVLEATSIGVPTLTTPYALGRLLGEHGGVSVVDPTPDAIADGIREVSGPAGAEIGRSGARVVREELAWPRLASSWLSQVEALLEAA